MQEGTTTAETAVVLPLLLCVTIGLVWLVSVGISEVRAVDAAREAARSAARGDGAGVARDLGERVAPPHASVGVKQSGGTVVATVAVTVRGPAGIFEFLPAFTVHAQAVASAERSR